ncbi:hypothetical protein SAMN02990966_06493 [Rhodospirillales bacterium URHD0017]|nr:hypothetical protein SAMN02990966_06493 [Rhodospirillales bacterium URHD0017]
MPNKPAQPKPPPPPPSSWRVHLSTATTPLLVTATAAAISAGGALVFKGADGGLLRAFAFGSWATCELDGPANAAVLKGD